MRSRGLLTVAIALATASAAAARIAVVGPGGGGDIECVLASRHDPSRLFAGCDVGGFYFSSDFGRHWEIRNVGLGCPGVQTIAEHPKDPNRLAIGGHAGILLSDDLGLNWHQATNGLPAPSPDGHSAPVVKIVWDENDTNRLWAATGLPHDGKERSRVAGTRGRVYRSDDGGESWNAALRKVPHGWVSDFWSSPVVSLDVSRAFPSNIVFGTMSGIHASEDAGATWAQRYTAEDVPPGKIAGTGLDTLCVADIRPDRFVPNRIRVAFYDVGKLRRHRGPGRA